MSNNYEWLTINQAFTKESELREDRNVSDFCSYGIVPLDEAQVCIMPNELVVIGADSAVGKTELCLQIARHNLHQGKRVALYHLEGGWLEAVSRMKWKDICLEYYLNRNPREFINMDYRNWILNNVSRDEKAVISGIENIIWERYKNEYHNNLHFFSSKNGLTVDGFLMSLLDHHKWEKDNETPIAKIKFNLDLIIIDHLQYFSLIRGENEISEITEILRQVKNITDNFNVPVVLISHLRKKSKDRGLPDQEDFYGSSNIPKIASTAITLAPDFTNENLSGGIFPTWIRIVKSRIGIRPNYAMLVNFVQNTKNYEDKYKIHKLTSEGYALERSLRKGEMPLWAVSAYSDDIKKEEENDTKVEGKTWF